MALIKSIIHQGDDMNTRNDALDAQADQLVEEALQELDLAEPGEADIEVEIDDYTWQCEYAGCYPWLDSAARDHLHDSMMGADDAGQPG